MATATNQDQLNEVTDELIRRVQDALLAALGTINIGEQQRIGLLAAIDNLSSAPVGNLQTLLARLTLQNVAGRSVIGGSGPLMAKTAYGLGDEGPSYASPTGNERLATSFTRYPSSSSSPFGAAGSGFRTRYTASGSAHEIMVSALTGEVLSRIGTGGHGSNGDQVLFDAARRMMDNMNMVGQVQFNSQGGLRGAAFERGSNADGEYTIDAGRRMICTQTLDFNNVSSGNLLASWRFPRRFASPPTVTYSAGWGSAQAVNCNFSDFGIFRFNGDQELGSVAFTGINPIPSNAALLGVRVSATGVAAL